MKGAFPLADLNPGVSAALTAVRMESNAYIGLSVLDRAHQLLCGESLVRVCGGQGCDTRHLVRVNNDVCSLGGVYVFGVCASGGLVYGGLPLVGERG